MALATKPPTSQQRPSRAIWKSPTSRARWLWLIVSVVLYGIIFAIYFPLVRADSEVAPKNNTLLLIFGIVAFLMVLAATAFSLRSRFMRGLPGKAQDWLWMHTWVAIAAAFVAMLHSNYAHILRDQLFNVIFCADDAYCGGTAIFALILLVISGIVGRLLDRRQAGIISKEASTNKVGIARAVKERILELEYIVERLSAGKSEAFKQYCIQAVDGESIPGTSFADTFLKQPPLSPLQQLPLPALKPNEQADFQRAHETLTERSHLVQSLRRQERARITMRTWRYVHIVIACLALFVITFHSIMELLSYVLRVIPIQQSAG